MKLSLTRLLVLIMLAITLLLVIGVICISLQHYDAVNEASRYQREEALEGAAKRLEQSIGSLLEASTVLSNLESVRTFCAETDVRQYESLSLIRSVLDSVVRFCDPVEVSILCMADDKQVYSTQQFVDVKTFIDIEKIIAKYVPETAFYGAEITPVASFTENQGHYFAVISPIIKGTYRGAGMLLCSAVTLAEQALSPELPCVLMCGDVVVFCNDEEVFEQDAIRKNNRLQAASGVVLLQKEIGGVPWTLYTGFIPRTALQEIMRSFQENAIVILLVLLVQGVLTILLYKVFILPFVDITKQVTSLNRPGETISKPNGSCNELIVLTDDINDMLTRMNHLAFRVSKSDIMLNHAVMSRLRERNLFLQAQINPHFLYNCLECIRGMVAENEHEATERMITSMATIYRYCAAARNDGTLQGELDIAHHYFTIVQTRYTESFKLCISVPEFLREWQVPRMVLQPILENAIKYGMIQDKRTEGCVYISAKQQNDMLTLEISNDGADMKEDRIAYYNGLFSSQVETADEKGRDHNGLLNVHNRIRLVFGAKSGLSLLRREGGGVIVRMSIGQKQNL